MRVSGERSAEWRRVAPLAAVVGLLGLVIVAAALSSPRVTRAPFERSPASPPPPGAPSETAEPIDVPSGAEGLVSTQLPDWVAKVALAVVFTTLIAVVGGLLWMLIRQRLSVRRRVLTETDAPPTLAENLDEVVAAVDSGLAELDADGDARAAVIACWLRFEELAAAVGTPREVGDTSTDLVVRLLGAHEISASVLDRLASLYREARYATHVVDEQMREEARGALRQLRTELVPEVVAP